MSVLKRKSNIALIAALIVVLSLIPVWYTMLAPSIIASEIEKIDITTSYEGTLGKEEYTKFLDSIIASELEKIDMKTSYEGTLRLLGEPEAPILIEVHVYAKEVKGDNVTLGIDANTTRTDTNETLTDFSYNLTYVFNKFTLENVRDAPEADKPREGCDPLFPSHLKADEDIPNAWLDNLNITATLEFQEGVEEEGVELYKYHVNETVIKTIVDPEAGPRNITFTSTKTILIEPLSGFWAYTENETLSVTLTYKTPYPPYPLIEMKLIRLKFHSTAEAKAQGIADAKKAHDDLEYLESLHSVSPILIEAYVHAEGVKGDNVIVKVEAEVTRTDTGETLPDFAQDLTYVFNKFTRKNDPEAPDADKNRTGYDPLYPSHLKKGENITAWFDMLNETATLEFQESVKEEGVTLYRYSGRKTITKPTYMGFTDCTLSLTRTVLIEPLSGLPAYTENETFCFNVTRAGYPSLPLVYLTYESTDEAKADGLKTAKASYEGLQLLELYLPTILGVITIVLIIVLAFNVRRLRRKKLSPAPT